MTNKANETAKKNNSQIVYPVTLRLEFTYTLDTVLCSALLNGNLWENLFRCVVQKKLQCCKIPADLYCMKSATFWTLNMPIGSLEFSHHLSFYLFHCYNLIPMRKSNCPKSTSDSLLLLPQSIHHIVGKIFRLKHKTVKCFTKSRTQKISTNIFGDGKKSL